MITLESYVICNTQIKGPTFISQACLCVKAIYSYAMYNRQIRAHLFYEMHASGIKCNCSYSLCSSKKIGIPLVQVACLHSEFIWHVGWPIWSEETSPTHEGLALNVHIVIKCMENSFITSITITDKYCIDYWQLLQESKKFSDD